MKQTQILSWIIGILIIVLVAISVYAYNTFLKGDTDKQVTEKAEMVMPTENDGEAMMREHCKGMPEMQGCEKYR